MIWLVIMMRFWLHHAEFGKTIIRDPLGWDGSNKTIRRDMTTHGVFFEYTPRIRFVKNGRGILKYLRDKYGVEADVRLRVQEKNLSTRLWRTIFDGRINFAGYSCTPVYFECNAERTGFVQRLKNRSDVKVNLDSLVSQGGTVLPAFTDETTSVELHSAAIRKVFQSDQLRETAEEIALGGDGTYYLLMTNEGYDVPASVPFLDELEKRFDYPTQISTLNPVTAAKYIFKCKEAGVYTFDLSIKAQVFDENTGNTHDWTMRWWRVRGQSGSYTTTQIGTDVVVANNYNVSGTFALTDSATLAAGDEIFIYGELVVDFDGAHGDIHFTPNVPGRSRITISAVTVTPATTHDTKLIHEALERVTQSCTDQADASFYSTYFGRTENGYASDGPGSLRCLVPGKRLRGLAQPFSVSFNDLLKSLQAIDGVGYGIEKIAGVERVRVESIDHFYQKKRLLRLTWCKDITERGASELMYNELKVGYDKWNVNGKQVANLDEFNVPRDWALPITQVKNTLTLKSTLVAGGYPLEYTRRDRESLTTDSEYDNETFIVQLRRDGGNLVTDQLEDFPGGISGVVDDDTVYNMKLSPVRMIKRNGSLIRSCLEYQVDKQIKFTPGVGNTNVVSFETGVASLNSTAGLQECGDIDVSKLDAPLWLPRLFTVRARLTQAELEALNTTDPDAAANVFGYVEFSETDRRFKRGFVYQAEVNGRDVKLDLLEANF